ncbi:MAG: hypothetical protein KBF88_11915, partial [Polyangiaceae bacterium]|nr:hypothetical protein [Polyangiaceae bacterium]
LWGAGNGKGLNMYLAIEGSNQLGMAFDIDVRSTCFRAVTKYNNDSPSAQQHTEAELVIMGDITP